jgi:Arc/MetJ family transcription regulator
MRTTVDLDDELVKQAFKASGIQKKTELIEQGLRLIIRRHAAQKLIEWGGSDPTAKAPPRRRFPAK